MIFVAVLVVIMFSGTMSRDYKIVLKGGPHLESKTPVLGPPGFSLDNGVENKLTINIAGNGAVGYDLQVSRFKSMLFARTYRTAVTKKEIGLMPSGKTYYVRSRSVVVKTGTTRRIHGNWSEKRSVKIK